MNRDYLKELIQSGLNDQAIKLVQGTQNHDECEVFVYTILGEGKSTPELTEAVLEAFLGTRENRAPQHGRWVHSLSHFNKLLWVLNYESNACHSERSRSAVKNPLRWPKGILRCGASLHSG